MAKSKSSNPADAYRKALKAKELKKNKEARKQVRETQTIKRDTRDIESEIKRLTDAQKQKPLSALDAERLKSLDTELSHIIKTKEAYVKAHPEARDRVFRTGAHTDRPRRDGDGGDGEGKQDLSHLYDESGRLRDPTRSVYFDPVYNPWGVPPPGMPYRERTPESSESEEDSEDEDIVMPEGPPPAGDEDEDSDDSDDIPLPEGPPPPKLPPASPAGPSGWGAYPPPMHWPPRPSLGFPPPVGLPPFPGQPQLPFRPPPQQPGFRPPPSRPSRPAHGPAPVVQDPLSDTPTQTYQGYRAAKHALPVRPPSGSSTDAKDTNPDPGSASSLPTKPPPNPAALASATISAAPVLRDLRKEATAFVPRGVKRKAAKPVPGGVSVNAAPGRGEVDEDGDERLPERESGGGLLGKLQGVIGDLRDSGEKGSKGATRGADDDYQRFLEGLGELS